MTHPRTSPAIAAIAAAAFAALLGGLFAAHPAAAQTASGTPSGDARHGKVAFVAHGCDECHGSLGQGNRGFGVTLAPHPIPYAAFLAQLRRPRAVMPPFGPKVLGERDAADIYAYLAAIPAGKPAMSIPILAAVDNGNAGPARTASGDAARGRTVFAQNCVTCHGASGGGGAGPSLHGEKTRKDLAAAIGFIENPVAPMPKLYPAHLSTQDVADVAAYVESL